MPNTSDYQWPPMEKRKVMGKRISRVDGLPKASGRAKYAYDFYRKDLLFAVLVGCPHAHARVKSVDDSAAKSMKGVTAIEWSVKPGSELQWKARMGRRGQTEEIARDAARAIKVESEVLRTSFARTILRPSEIAPKPRASRSQAIPDRLQKRRAGARRLLSHSCATHCCLEAHGQTIEWKPDGINYWPSTQGVPLWAMMAQNLTCSANTRACRYAERRRRIRQQVLGRPLGRHVRQSFEGHGGHSGKPMLERDIELMTAGIGFGFRLRSGGWRIKTENHRVAIEFLGHRRHGRRRSPSHSVRLHQIPHVPSESQRRRPELRWFPCVARPEPSAGVLPHLQRARRSGPQAEYGPG